MSITYTNEKTTFKLRNKQLLTRWIKEAIVHEGFTVGDIAVVLCSDEYLLDINRRFLEHDYYTDIITFDYTEGDRLSGDLLISVDTVRGNADEYGALFHVELLRVIIHGIMHLVGYKDKDDQDAAKMRERENYYLSTAPMVDDLSAWV